jgi:cobaltochelatase CobN
MVVYLLMVICQSVIAYGQEKAESQAEIAFLGIWDRAAPLVERASRETGIRAEIFSVKDFLQTISKNPSRLHRVIYVLNLNPPDVPALVEILRRAKENEIPFVVISLDERDTQLPLEKAGLLKQDAKVNKYWKYGGLINMKRLLQYSSAIFLGKKADVLPPVVIPDFGIYHPEAMDIFSSSASYRSWYQKEGHYTPASPWVVMLIHGSFWVTGDTKDLDALIRCFEKHGVNIATVFGDTFKRIYELVKPFEPDLLLLQVHSPIPEGREGETKSFRGMNIPFLKPISLLGATVEEWLKDPKGLTPKDVGLHLTVLESQGIIEPIVIGGLKVRTMGFRIHKPIPERIKRFVQRAIAWINLRKKANAEKRVAIVYYNKYLGKSDLLHGSPTGAYLDGPRSLISLLRSMKRAGYSISKLPQDEKELIQWILRGSRNVGPWAKGELIDLVEKGKPILIPLSTYKKWFDKLPQSLQDEVVEKFGPPPGRLMVYEENRIQYIVIPRIDLGNIILLPQPARGEEQNERLLHSRTIPPPHNYIAFYLWLQREFKADAIIHFGTHGTLELLPLKAAGLSNFDWGDILIGEIPNIQPWIIDNLGEATLAKRRAYAVLVDHLVPPIISAGLSADYKDLHDEIEKFETLEEGLLREQFRKSIYERSTELNLFQDMGIEAPRSPESLTDSDIQKIAEYLHQIYNQRTPMSLHILGRLPPPKELIPYIVSILGSRFLEELSKNITVPADEGESCGVREKFLRSKGEAILKHILLQGKSAQDALCRENGKEKMTDTLMKELNFAQELYRRFSLVGQEIDNVLSALEGKYVPPGPGNDPVRNPSALPTGRNMYAVNPEEIPVKPAWETAKILVDQLLKKKLETEGCYPRKIGFDLNGHETMRHYGVTEGQILYLLGVRPVWNENNLVVDVELIPKEELKRPRIDVFIAMGGSYRDNFPSRVELLDKAVRLVAAIEEDENYVRDFTQNIEKRLLEQGFSSEAASNLSKARIFGAKPGEFGTRILHLIPRSGVWDNVQEVTSVYKATMSYVYTRRKWGVKVEALYETAMMGTDTIIRTWSSNMTSPLTNHHFYEYLGGLNLAVKEITGNNPSAYIADVRDPDKAKVETFENALQREYRVRLFNKRWIKGMMANGYAGAGQMAELVKNTFGWKVTRPESVRDDTWEEILNIYVRDKYHLGLQEWFDEQNPYAVQEIVATLLESVRKGYWSATDKDIQELTRTFIASVSEHGLSAGLITGGNSKLVDYVKRIYNAPGASPQPDLLAKFESQLQHSAGPPGDLERVRGKRLEKNVSDKERTGSEKTLRSILPEEILTGLAVLLLIYIGYRVRSGVPSSDAK